MKWDTFVDSLARRGGQNLILWSLTIMFAIMVSFHKLPAELSLTPIITGMMAFMTHSSSPGSDSKPPNGDKKDGQ